jgi:hypothetical protein
MVLAGGNFVGFEGLQVITHGRGKPGQPAWADGVDGHAELVELQAGGLGEPDDRGLGGGIVRLTEVADQAGSRGGVDDPAGEFLAGIRPAPPVPCRVVHEQPGAAHVHPHDQVEVSRRHVPDHLVARDAGIVDQDVQPAEFRYRPVDQGRTLVVVGNVAVVGHGDATSLADQRDYLVGILARALAVDAGTQVVDHDLRAVPGEFQRMAPTDAMTGPGDYRDLVLEESGH